MSPILATAGRVPCPQPTTGSAVATPGFDALIQSLALPTAPAEAPAQPRPLSAGPAEALASATAATGQPPSIVEAGAAPVRPQLTVAILADNVHPEPGAAPSGAPGLVPAATAQVAAARAVAMPQPASVPEPAQSDAAPAHDLGPALSAETDQRATLTRSLRAPADVQDPPRAPVTAAEPAPQPTDKASDLARPVIAAKAAPAPTPAGAEPKMPLAAEPTAEPGTGLPTTAPHPVDVTAPAKTPAPPAPSVASEGRSSATASPQRPSEQVEQQPAAAPAAPAVGASARAAKQPSATAAAAPPETPGSPAIRPDTAPAAAAPVAARPIAQPAEAPDERDPVDREETVVTADAPLPASPSPVAPIVATPVALPIPVAISFAPLPTTLIAVTARPLRSLDAARPKAEAPAADGPALDPTPTDPPIGDVTALVLPDAQPVATAPAPAAPAGPAQPLGAAGAPAAPEAGVTHHLAAAHDAQMLDQIARDIVATGSADGRLRFQLSADRLGRVGVELAQTDEGAAIRLIADSEAQRSLLLDAQPRLHAEARAQGLRVAETHVDLGTATAATTGNSTPPPAPSGGTGLGTGGQSSGHSGGQPQHQPFQHRAPSPARFASATNRPAATPERRERYA